MSSVVQSCPISKSSSNFIVAIRKMSSPISRVFLSVVEYFGRYKSRHQYSKQRDFTSSTDP